MYDGNDMYLVDLKKSYEKSIDRLFDTYILVENTFDTKAQIMHWLLGQSVLELIPFCIFQDLIFYITEKEVQQ